MAGKDSGNGKAPQERFSKWKSQYGIPSAIPDWCVGAFYGTFIDPEYEISDTQKKFVDFCIGMADTILAIGDFLVKAGIPIVEWGMKACQGIASLVGAESLAKEIGANVDRLANFKELNKEGRKSIAHQIEELSGAKDNAAVREDRPHSLYPVQRRMEMKQISDLDPRELRQVYALLETMSKQILDVRKVESIRIEIDGNNSSISGKNDTGLDKQSKTR